VICTLPTNSTGHVPLTLATNRSTGAPAPGQGVVETGRQAGVTGLVAGERRSTNVPLGYPAGALCWSGASGIRYYPPGTPGARTCLTGLRRRGQVLRPVSASRIRSTSPAPGPRILLAGGLSGAAGCGRVGAICLALVTFSPRVSSCS
jgi:hypothetical protein